MSILFEQLLESLDLEEACDKNLNEASEQARNAFISLVRDNELGWEEALDLALGEIDDDTVDMMIDDVRDYNRFVSMHNDTVDEACEKELKEDMSVTPGKDKAFELIAEFDNSRDMLEELIRYLPEDTVKEFVDYYAENFMGLFDDELDESITDKGDIGPKVLAKLEEIINNNTKFRLDTDPDGKMILTDPKQLQFKVDINGNEFVLMDKSGKIIIRDTDPEKFIKRFIVFVTD